MSKEITRHHSNDIQCPSSQEVNAEQVTILRIADFRNHELNAMQAYGNITDLTCQQRANTQQLFAVSVKI